MIKISEEIKKLYIEDSTPIELEVRFNDNAFPTINGSDVLSEQMTLHESICEEEQLKFGGCNASSFELTVFNLNSGIKGYEIKPVLITNKTEIPLGVFYVETIEKYAGKDYKKLTAYDKMRYFDVDVKDWYDNLTFPISVKNFRDSLCEYVGVEQNEVTLIADNIMLTKELDSSSGINGLSLMKQICEISGVFGRMDRYGKFDYLSLESSMLLPADDLYPANDLYPSAGSGSSENSFNISTSLMYEHPLVEDFFTSNIDGVIIVDSEGAEYITENKGNPYFVQDNFAIIGQSYDTITQLAIDLAKKISNISYRPVNSSKIKGQPYVECGDFISGEVNGYGFEAYVFQRDLTGIKALRDAYICKGKELLENDMNGVTATLQRLNNSIGKTKVIIEKTEKGLRGEISQSLEESKQYTDSSASSTLDSANNYAQEAAQGAMNAANNNTNEKLKSYYTKTEADTKLEATANGFSAEITSTQKVLKEYADNAASSAQSEAISSANASTDKKLKNYYTKEENDNQFDATAQGFTAQISSTKEELQKYTDNSSSATLESANNYAQDAAQGAINAANNNTNEKLKSYYTKEESDLQIKASSDSLSSTISKTQSKWDLVSSDGKKDYRNKKVNYGFGKTTNGSELFVDSDGKYYYLDVSSGIMYQIIKLGGSGEDTQYGIEEQTQLRTIESHTSSEISQISNEIVLKVDADGKIVKVSLRGSETGTEFKVNADNIELSASDVINLLSGGTINLTASNINIGSEKTTITKEGKLTCEEAEIKGKVTLPDALYMIGKRGIFPIIQGDNGLESYKLVFRDLKNVKFMEVESSPQGDISESVSFKLETLFEKYARFRNGIRIGEDTDYAYATYNKAKKRIEFSGDIDVGGATQIATNKILWSGTTWPNETSTLNLLQKVTQQAKGIVLVFSTSSDLNDFQYVFIPKNHVIKHSGKSVYITLSDAMGNKMGKKIVYVYDDKIVGHAINDSATYTSDSGIKFSPNGFILTEVIGI